MPPDQFQAEYSRAVAAVTAAAERCELELENADEPTRRENARAYFAALATAAKLYAQSWRRAGGAGVSFSPELALRFASIADYVARGVIPDLVRHCIAPGAPAQSPATLQQIEIAVAYVLACRAGKIADHAPVKTITSNYGISRKTAERWMTANPDALGNCAALAHGSVDGLCETLPGLMASSGEAYRKGGAADTRGGAQANRSRKRAPALPTRRA